MNPMLQDDENVLLAFKSGRDMMIFTTRRMLIMDVQGFSGKKILWMSVPYTSLRAFSVESAGSWDRDSEVKLFCKTYWMDGVSSVIKQDLRKGRADIIQIQSLLAHYIIGLQDGSRALDFRTVHGNDSAMTTLISFLADDGVATDAKKLEETLKSSPPILQVMNLWNYLIKLVVIFSFSLQSGFSILISRVFLAKELNTLPILYVIVMPLVLKVLGTY